MFANSSNRLESDPHESDSNGLSYQGIRPSAVDLFCGAGGLSLGLHTAGFDVLFAADSWKPAIETYRLNFRHPVLEVDLSQIDALGLWRKIGTKPRKVDLLVGGPPCQGFSIQRIGADQDTRNNLVIEFARLISEMEPKLFVMENVPGLLGKRGHRLTLAFERRLSDAGYRVEAVVADASWYGVPQFRKRVFYYGWKNGLPSFSFPSAIIDVRNPRTVGEAIGDLPSPPPDYTPAPGDQLHRRTRLSATNQHRIDLIPPGGGMQDLPPDLRVNCHREGPGRIGHRYVYGRMSADRPAATITARFDSFTRGKFGHPSEPRNITLREGARLQSFPDTFLFYGTQEEIAAQIGNAVPPTLATIVAQAAFRYLQNSQDSRGSESVKKGLLPIRTTDQPPLFSEER